MTRRTDNPIIFKACFYQTIIRELLNSASMGNMMSAMLMGLCTIDYMSVPLALPKKNTRTHFKQFLTDYMSKINPKYFETDIQKKIYAIRCSLVHVFGDSDATEDCNIVPEFFIGRLSNNLHLCESQNLNYEDRFFLSIPKFIGEIVSSVAEYFKQNETKIPSIAPEWGKKLYWLGGGGIFNVLASVRNNSIIYRNIHSFLSIMDDSAKTTSEIAEYIAEQILIANGY